MAWFLCDACGARVDAESTPGECNCCHSGTLLPAEELRSRDTDPELVAAAVAAVKLNSSGERVPEEVPTDPMGSGSEDTTDPMVLTLEEPIKPLRTFEISDSDILGDAAQQRASGKTQELDDSIYDAPTPAAPPMTAVPLAALRTEELAEEDMEELSSPQAMTPVQPLVAATPDLSVQPKVIVAPRPRKGRIAFPISDTDRTPPPSISPADADEAEAEAEETGTGVPLPGQTEHLPDLAARRLRKVIATASGLIVLGGVVIYLVSARRPDQVATHVATPVSAVRPDQRFHQQIDTGVDRSKDHWRLDSSWPDKRHARRTTRIGRATGAELTRTTAANDSGPAVSPDEAKSAYREGLRNLMQGNSGAAIRMFKEALRKDPRLSLAYRGLGLAYEQQGDKESARAAFSRYLVLQPSAEDADAIRERIERLK